MALEKFLHNILQSIYFPHVLVTAVKALRLGPRLVRRLWPLIVGPDAAVSIIVDYFGDAPEAVEAFNPLPGQVVVDVGAHIGAYTIVGARRVGKAGKVIAVEAHPDNCKILLRNLKLNGLRNVTPVNVAALNREGCVKLYLGKKSACHSVVEEGRQQFLLGRGKFLTVPCTTLDRLFAKLGIEEVDWVKIDVEGAELDVLKGMSAILHNNSELNLMMELHSHHAEVVSLLKRFGFDVKVLRIHEDRRWHIYASRKENERI